MDIRSDVFKRIRDRLQTAGEPEFKSFKRKLHAGKRPVRPGEEPKEEPVAIEPASPPVEEPEPAAEVAPVKRGKKKAEAEPKPRVTAKKSISRFLMATVQEQQAKEGITSASVGGEAGQMMLGIKCPLAFQYLTQHSHFPLGLIYQLVGTHGTMKSGLVAEVGRWFAEAGGYLCLIENESKLSPDWFESIMGYPDETGVQVMKVRRAKSTDDWQAILQEEIGLAKKLMLTGDAKHKIPATGITFPVMFAVDSLTGKLSKESQERIEKAGFADRAHPHEALQITQFLKKIPQDIAEWPMAVVGVNHMKPKKAEGGFHTERVIGGGRTILFQESFEIQMSADKAQNFSRTSNDDSILETRGRKLTIDCYKNSMGETLRTPLHVTIEWDYCVLPTGDVRQRTKWNWPMAIVDLLLSYKEGRAKKIAEVCDLTLVTGGRVWSKALSIPKSDPVSKTEAGKLIEADPAIVKGLQQLLAIKTRTEFEPGRDFQEQLEAVRQENERRMNSL
jgi:hypothetical protein